MSPLLFALAVLVLSVVVAVPLARRLARNQSPVLLPPELAPEGDPHLGLLVRANHALGAWILAGGEEEPRESLARRLPPEAAAVVRARLPGLARAPEGGAERLEHGLLLYRGDGQGLGAVLLPPDAPPGARQAVERDLAAALSDLRQRPVLADVTRQQGRPHESVESVAVRLAHQVERLLDTEVAVALARPAGVQVMGVSLRSDPRLLLAIAAPGSALDRVARGVESEPVASDDPLGRSAHERRRARPGAVVLPIPGGALPVGAVVVSLTRGELPPHPLRGELLAAIERAGPRLAAALERSELEETASTDSLTGLRNRRGLDRELSRIDQRDGVLVYADLDRFKQLNDTLGHAAGDAALVHFARLLIQMVRTRDVVARIGGEEFAIWLPDVTLLEGTAVAERIRATLAGTSWAWQGKAWPISASFGVAGCPETAPDRRLLAERADEALYEAKRAGRDRVVTAM